MVVILICANANVCEVKKEEKKKKRRGWGGGEGGGKQAVADLSFAELFGSHVLILLVKVSIAVHCS